MYGGIQLTEDEEYLLRQRPELALYSNINMAEIEQEVETTLTQIRWTRIETGYRQEETEEGNKPENKELIKKMNYNDRIVYNREEHKIDLTNRCATDMKNNRRVFLPKGRPPNEEAELRLRAQMWKSKVEEYVKEKCDPKGNQVEDNLNAQLKRGLEFLIKKTKEGELIVIGSDKGNTVAVLTPEILERLGMEAIGKEREISESEIETIQRRLTAHGRSLVKIFNIGQVKGENNGRRCWNNASSEAEAVPLLTLAPKTHKPLKTNGDPQTRGIIWG